MSAPAKEFPLLAQVRIASPCSADWEQMTGDERVRFCGACRRHVYNLSEMTAPEAEALIREREGNFCGRIYRRADGTIITADCPYGFAAVQARLRRAMYGAFLIGLTLFLGTLQRLYGTEAADHGLRGALQGLKNQLTLTGRSKGRTMKSVVVCGGAVSISPAPTIEYQIVETSPDTLELVPVPADEQSP